MSGSWHEVMPFDRLHRREFITLLGGAAAAWPLSGWTQPSSRMRRIGMLMHLASDDADAQSRNAAFLQGMQELGWAVGRNVRIDYRWGASNFDPERMRKGAVELVALGMSRRMLKKEGRRCSP
jgi:putative ABC transport system substrate-binding protein